MSSTSELTPLPVLQSRHRQKKRSIDNSLRDATTLISTKQAADLSQIDFSIKEAAEDLKLLLEINDEMIEHIDSSGKADSALQAEQDKVYEDYEKLHASYRECKGKYLTLVQAFEESKKKEERAAGPRQSLGLNSSLVETNSVKLPRVELKKFSGNIKEFHDWAGLFENVIINDDKFDDVQRIYYLKTLLIGDAAKLVENVPIDATSFKPTWKAITDFYGNKRSLIAQHFAEVMDLPPIKTDEDIRHTICTVSAAMRGLEAHGVNAKAMSPMITFVVVCKFSATIRREWEKSNTDTSNYPEFSALESFLKTIAFAFEGAKNVEKSGAHDSTAATSTKPKKGTVAATTTATNSTSKKADSKSDQKANKSKFNSRPDLSCVLCSNSHYLAWCGKFIAMSLDDRCDTVRRFKLCENCLKPNHIARDCAASSCKKCSRKHNTTLYPETASIPETPSSAASGTKPPSATVAVAAQKITRDLPPESSVFLPAAIGLVVRGWRETPVRILIDDCAMMTLVSEDFIKRHQIPTFRKKSFISGSTPVDYASDHAAKLTIKSTISNFQMVVTATLHPMLSYHVDPAIMSSVRKQFPDMFPEPVKLDHDTVDIILGSNYLYQCMLPGKRIVDTLILEETKFGWVASGVLNLAQTSTTRSSCYCIVDVTDHLQKFFEVEEVEVPSAKLPEAERIEEHFQSSVRQLPNSKLSVGMPYKGDKMDVADTFRMAVAALIRNEKYLNVDAKKLYADFMQEYLDMGHMSPIPYDEIARKPCYYLPHHAVIRESSLTTKLRAVFNASASNSTGCSLNEVLMVGPTIQPDLLTLLINFCCHAIAVTADISKMYRCIEVHPEDRDMQRIVWRSDPSQPIQHYRLNTVTYGTSSAPFLATRCLQRVADDNERDYPEAAASIRTEFYMDDWLSGSTNVANAVQKQRDVHRLLSSYQLPLVKYSSNSKEFLASLSNNLVDSLRAVEFNSNEVISILGLKWLPEEDTLTVRINPECTELRDQSGLQLTQRRALSLVSKVFDPLGLLAPVTVAGKILMQDVWREEIGWDDKISEATQLKFAKYFRSLAALDQFRIPRCYRADYTECSRQLIGFCDASDFAYSAVVYLRLSKVNSSVTSILVCSKTKVAPMKPLTTPRLELCGAVLLSKLIRRVCQILDINLEQVTCFSDSTIALTWIYGPSENYTVFVRNRSNFVNSIVPSKQWFHVNGDHNPADLSTRGISTAEFLKTVQFWIHGPSWLIENFDSSLVNDLPASEEVPEKRHSKPQVVAVAASIEPYVDRFSSFSKLLRITAILLRYRDRVRGQLLRSEAISALTTEAINSACTRVLQLTQEVFYSKELAALQKQVQFPARSPLRALNAFLHSDGLLRVGGRLSNAALPFDQRHPIIIPRHCKIAILIVRDLHKTYYHANCSLLTHFVRSKYWIVGGCNKLVKSVLRQCTFCVRLSAATRVQIMGDLPAARVQVSRPFTHTGVDYAGPLQVKCTGHRTTKFNKAYLAFFVCFATKAIHIEVALDLTTEMFFHAFDRFISRRGVPNVMYSDNGTNFVGFANITQHHLTHYATKHKFSWKFIPARSPHVGGLWEAAVKAGKKLLLKAVGKQVLTFEELATITTKVEAILNSRPLCSDSSIPTAFLTPAHFLAGCSLLEAPAADSFNVSLSRRFRLTRQIIESFWTAWKQDYLHQLQLRAKWQNREADLQVGDVVLLKKESPVLSWRMAKITKILPGPDGAVRSIEVLCNGRTRTRSVQSVVALPKREVQN